MEEMKFHNLNDLFNHLYPAFNTKVKQCIKEGVNVSEVELWGYLKENVWKYSRGLSIYEMVDDILSFDIEKIKVMKK